jgi:hypothetical protein
METYSRIGLLQCHGNLQSYWTTTMPRKLTVVLDYYNSMETYSRIGLLQCHGNLQSYWTTTILWKLTVVLDYYNATETYSRIAIALLIRSLFNNSHVSIILGRVLLSFRSAYLKYSFAAFNKADELQVYLTSSPLVSSVVYHLLHSFRVYFLIFSTRFECRLSSSSLVLSAFSNLID